MTVNYMEFLDFDSPSYPPTEEEIRTAKMLAKRLEYELAKRAEATPWNEGSPPEFRWGMQVWMRNGNWYLIADDAVMGGRWWGGKFVEDTVLDDTGCGCCAGTIGSVDQVVRWRQLVDPSLKEKKGAA